MKDIQQLIKKNNQEGRYNDIFPKTFLDAVRDRQSGMLLSDILAGFNMYFLPYVGSKKDTRLQVPKFLRRRGLIITYVTYDNVIVTERYKQEAIDDITWGDDNSWDNLWDTSDYIKANNAYGFNVTVFGIKGGRHTIETAVLDVPPEIRVIGHKITFAQYDGTWATYQLQSMSLSDYTKPEKWVKLEGITNTGSIVITNQPDEEDITVDRENLLKFADKEYNESSFSGLGRVYLRKNIVDGKNVLTQEMISKANTRYIVQYDYDLNGTTITIPEGCVLEFQGGSFRNGTVKGNNTSIRADNVQIFSNIVFEGEWLVPLIYISWMKLPSNNSREAIFSMSNLLTDKIYNKVVFPATDIYWTPEKNTEDKVNRVLFSTKSNTDVILNGNIFVNGNNLTNYEFIYIKDCENVKIIGGHLIGDVGNHEYIESSTSEWGMGVSISNSNNIIVDNVISEKMIGDGFYLGSGCSNIIIQNCRSIYNRRQGLSIISGENVIVKDCTFLHTGRIEFISPGFGIDIEPNSEKDKLYNLLFENCTSWNNRYSNIGFYLKNSPAKKIRIVNCDLGSNDYDIDEESQLRNPEISLTCDWEFDDFVIENTRLSKVEAFTRGKDGSEVLFNNCEISCISVYTANSTSNAKHIFNNCKICKSDRIIASSTSTLFIRGYVNLEFNYCKIYAQTENADLIYYYADVTPDFTFNNCYINHDYLTIRKGCISNSTIEGRLNIFAYDGSCIIENSEITPSKGSSYAIRINGGNVKEEANINILRNILNFNSETAINTPYDNYSNINLTIVNNIFSDNDHDPYEGLKSNAFKSLYKTNYIDIDDVNKVVQYNYNGGGDDEKYGWYKICSVNPYNSYIKLIAESSESLEIFEIIAINRKYKVFSTIKYGNVGYNEFAVVNNILYVKRVSAHVYEYLTRLNTSYRSDREGTIEFIGDSLPEGDVEQLKIIRTNGSSSNRPEVEIDSVISYFDTTLNKPIWLAGDKWVDANGYNADLLKKGDSSNRPTPSSTDSGFMYYDTTLSKYIVWSGSAWTNMDGTALLASNSALTMSFNHLEEVPASEDKTS